MIDQIHHNYFLSYGYNTILKNVMLNKYFHFVSCIVHTCGIHIYDVCLILMRQQLYNIIRQEI